MKNLSLGWLLAESCYILKCLQEKKLIKLTQKKRGRGAGGVIFMSLFCHNLTFLNVIQQRLYAKRKKGVKLADCTIIPVTFIYLFIYFFSLNKWKSSVCCCDKTNISMFLSMQQRFLPGKCSKRHPSPLCRHRLLTELRESKRPRGAWGGGGGGDKSRHSPERETVKRNDFTIQKKKTKTQRMCYAGTDRTDYK